MVLKMKAEDIRTESDYWEYCTLYSNGIFVREQVNGKWDNLSLEELSPERRVYHIRRMMEAGIIPTRVLTEEETNERNETS